MKKLFLIAACVTAAFSSCSNNDGNGQAAESDYLSVKNVSASVATRAELATGVLSSGSIGVFAYETTNYQNNVEYAYGSSAWSAANPVKLTDVGVKVYAYYPYTASVGGTDAAPIIAIPANNTAQQEYLYTGELAGSYTKTNNTVSSLKMDRALAKVVFKKLKDENYPGNGVISSIVMKNAASKTSLAATGQMDIKSGVITPTADQTVTYNVLSGASASFKDADLTASVMVLPAATFAEGDVFITLELDGETYDLNIPAGVWAKGTVNTYTLSVTTGSLSITSVEVKDWVNGVDEVVPVE